MERATICDKSFQREPKIKGIPRAFIKYNYTDISVPYPLHFVEGITNSFPDVTTRRYFL